MANKSIENNKNIYISNRYYILTDVVLFLEKAVQKLFKFMQNPSKV